MLPVDDHAPLCELLSHEHCALVGQAGNGQEALDVQARVDCDPVVMDLRMPVMNGLHATRAIAERYPAVKVVAFTSDSDATTVREIIEAGASMHFDKSNIQGLVDFVSVEALAGPVG